LLKRADVNDHIRHEPPPLEVLMARKVDPKVDEAIETLNLRDSPTRRRLLAGAGLVSATAAASALLTACSSSSSAASGASGSGAFPSTP
jgi:simple sugar transport system substrate-binding protein